MGLVFGFMSFVVSLNFLSCFHFVVASGTDDDFPPPHQNRNQNRMSRGGRISGNGRPAPVGSMPYPRMYEETDMEAKIHQLEQEAYSSVLRAFKAQADAITWVSFIILITWHVYNMACLFDQIKWIEWCFLQEKEGLITELRKELRLSNEEHRDLLSRVNADETIRRIRFSFICNNFCLLPRKSGPSS